MSSKGSDRGPAAAERGDAGATPWPGPGCPPAEALERLVLGTGSAEERESLVDHLTECEGCSELVRDLRSLEGWAERVGREHRRSRGARRWPLALAATLVVALGGAALWTRLPDRNAGPEAVRGAEARVTPAPGAELARPPESFSWPVRAGATGYRVHWFDAAGEPVWESGWVVEGRCEVPREVASGLPGGTYLWTVEVRGAAAGAELGPFAFVLAESGSGAGPGEL